MGTPAQAADGLRLVVEALATENKRGERYYQAELYRLKGELLCVQEYTGQQASGHGPACAEIEACFCQALAVARHQQAKSLELRAATSLARLWQRQGKRTKARQVLAPLYSWFTEGLDRPDLQEARVLLQELA